jgi:hypothetical protein
MSIFHQHPHFRPIDPLGDGLGDEIAAERAEPEHIELEESLDSSQLNEAWDAICSDLQQDPLWYSEQ